MERSALISRYRRDQIPRIYQRNAAVAAAAASKLELLRCRNFFVIAVVVGVESADR
jgi:hypothetical protein